METPDTGEQSLTLPPPPLRTGATCAVQYPMGRGVGTLEASRDMQTGQVASRVVPFPGPMVELGSRAAMADQGTRAAMADPGTWAAMADLGTWVAMADQVIGPTPWAMVGSPPPPTFSSGSPQPLGGAL